MGDLLAVHAASNPHGAAAIVDASGGAHPSVTTFAELNATANRLADAFGALGVGRGERTVRVGQGRSV